MVQPGAWCSLPCLQVDTRRRCGGLVMMDTNNDGPTSCPCLRVVHPAAVSEQVDTDGYWVADSVMLDTNGDGVADAVMLDTTGDGVADSVMMDTTGDGQLNEAVPMGLALE